MISDAQINELIESIDDASGRPGSYWQMLKHAEKHGFDLAVLKHDLHNLLASELGRALAPKDDAAERALILRLRDRMRREVGLPPLSSEERSRWRWETPPGLRRYRYVKPSGTDQPRSMTIDEVQAIAAHVRTAYPEVVRYLQAIRAHNSPLGYNGGPNCHLVVRPAWHARFLDDAICEVIGNEGSIWSGHFDIEVALAPLGD